MDFRITVKDGGWKQIAIMGAINEDSELALKNILADLAGVSKITFNFAQTTTINSLGVRAWVQFLRSVEEGRTVVFEQCSPDVISQINMIPSFSGKADITSFYTNYICESCNKTEKILLEKKNLAPKQIPEKAKCPSCSSEMETEELEDEYFAFLLK